METIAIVLTIGNEHVDIFERGFREHELLVWQDLRSRGLLARATLSRLDISTSNVAGATQYLVAAIFTSGEGHHAHDDHPGFARWNEIADRYQVAPAMAFGGPTIVEVGD